MNYWQHAKTLFENVIKCDGLPLSNPTSFSELSTTHQAVAFLADIGYLGLNDQTAFITSTSNDETTISNRLALLNLTSRCRDFFPLFSPSTEKLRFFGTLLSPAAFGITGHPTTSQGSGGKGFNAQQAFQACMGEAAEFLSFLRQENDPLIVREQVYDGFRQSEYDWINGQLGNKLSSSAKEVDCIEAISHRQHQHRLIPADLVLRTPPTLHQSTFKTPSNGVGAGKTFEEAMLNGILELIERDAMALWWFGHAPSFAINPDLLKDEMIAKTLEDAERHIQFFDITSDFNIPVVVATSSDSDGNHVICGIACDVTMSSAINKAYAEMRQMELAHFISCSRHEQFGTDSLSKVDLEHIQRYQNLDLNSYSQFNGVQPPRKLSGEISNPTLSYVVERIISLGYDIYTANLTRPEINVQVSRAIIPGLQPPNTHYISQRLKHVISYNNSSNGNAMQFDISPI